jgi:hypothetical protein
LGAQISNFQKQEWLFGSFAYLDINKAVKLLTSMGYSVSDSSGILSGENND